jgi:hypothetical protein
LKTGAANGQRVRTSRSATAASFPFRRQDIVNEAPAFNSFGNHENFNAAQDVRQFAYLLDEPSSLVTSVQNACKCSRVVAEDAVEAARRRPDIHRDTEAEYAIRHASKRMFTQGQALHEALAGNCFYEAQSLLNAGDVDLGVCGSWGKSGYYKTPLMLAVHFRRYHLAKEMCELILAGSVGKGEIDARDQQGFTALGLARAEGYPEMSALLVAHGADESRSFPRNTQSQLSNVRAGRESRRARDP